MKQVTKMDRDTGIDYEANEVELEDVYDELNTANGYLDKLTYAVVGVSIVGWVIVILLAAHVIHHW